MSNPASFAEIVDALRQAEAGLEVAVAHKPQTTKFVPSHVLALWAVKRVLERLPTEAAAMAATVPADEIMRVLGLCVGPLNVTMSLAQIHSAARSSGDVVMQCEEALRGIEALRVGLTAQAPVADQPAEPSPANVDYLGLALDLEKQAARVESQTAQRAMLAGARGLLLMGGKVGCSEPERCRGKQCEYCRDMATPKGDSNGTK